MTRHYPALGSASDWLNQNSHAARPIRSTTQIWVVTRHQYGIFALVSQTSSGGEPSGSIAKCCLFSQASDFLNKRQMLKLPAGYSAGSPRIFFFYFNSLKSPFLGFRVIQTGYWPDFILQSVFIIKNIFIMKNVIDFRKTVWIHA